MSDPFGSNPGSIPNDISDYLNRLKSRYPNDNEISEIEKKISSLISFFESKISKKNKDYNQAIQNLMQIVIAAGNLPDGKQFGCERCGSCTVDITKRISEMIDLQWGPEYYTVSFCDLRHFPRMLYRYIANILDLKRKGKGLFEAGVFIAEIQTLCNEALKLIDSKYYLAFSRVAHVIDTLGPDLHKTFGSIKRYPELEILRNEIRSKAAQITKKLEADEDSLLEQRKYWSKAIGNLWRQKNTKALKRIEGGGVVKHHDKSILDSSVLVIDFSKDFFLGLVDKPIEKTCTRWLIFPTQRELPFEVDFTPYEENKSLRSKSEKLPDNNVFRLKSCGKYCQLFRIVRIDPKYYWLSLCAESVSTHFEHLSESRINAHDWPEPAILKEVI